MNTVCRQPSTFLAESLKRVLHHCKIIGKGAKYLIGKENVNMIVDFLFLCLLIQPGSSPFIVADEFTDDLLSYDSNFGIRSLLVECCQRGLTAITWRGEKIRKLTGKFTCHSKSSSHRWV